MADFNSRVAEEYVSIKDKSSPRAIYNRNELVEAIQPFVWYVAKKVHSFEGFDVLVKDRRTLNAKVSKNASLELDDLISIGNMELLKNFEKFDPSEGSATTFFIPRLAVKMVNESLHELGDVHVPMGVMSEYFFGKFDSFDEVYKNEQLNLKTRVFNGVCKKQMDVNISSSIWANFKGGFVSLDDVVEDDFLNDFLYIKPSRNLADSRIGEGDWGISQISDSTPMDLDEMSVCCYEPRDVSSLDELVYTPECPVENRGVGELVGSVIGDELLTRREETMIYDRFFDITERNFLMKPMAKFHGVARSRMDQIEKQALRKIKRRVVSGLNGRIFDGNFSEFVEVNFEGIKGNEEFIGEYFIRHDLL